MKRVFIFICLHFFASPVFSQLNFRCVEVQDNGDVILHWLPIADPLGEFKNYQIYYSTNNIDFLPLSAPAHITNRLLPTYTHVGAAANLKKIYYKMVVEFASGGTPYYPFPDSDTLATMLINITNSVPVEDGYGHLDWNNLVSPKLSSTANTYNVFRKYLITDPWTNIGTANYLSEVFDDPDKVCQENPFYKVEITDISGCTSVSAVATGLVIDQKAPDAPIIDSVSVNITNNEVALSWVPDASIDLGGFIIVRNDAIIASLSSPVTIDYVDLNASPDQQARCYKVASTDNCLILDPPAPPSYNTSPAIYMHCTMYLEGVAYNCEKRIELKWTPYVGWGNDLSGYDLLVQEDGGAWSVLTTLNASATSFNHENLDLGTTYCYFIRAKHILSRTSSSNSICLKTSEIKEPAALYISCLNVEDDEVYISFYVPLNSEPTGYRILRSHRLDTTFVLVTDLQPSTKDTIYKWKDNGLGTDTVSYYYVIAALDSCDREYFYSDTANTILLQGTAYPNEFYNELYWNSYQGFSHANSEVNEYILYMSLSGKSNFVKEKSMGNSQVFYTHEELDDFLSSNGEFCYYLSAIEDSFKNVYGLAEVCNSNVECLNYQDLVWIPNTFTPDRDKINDVFKPIASFVDEAGYEFIIYNRWGEKVFGTTNFTEGWDGGGFEEPIGYYSYYLKYKNPYYTSNKNFVQKEYIIRRGSFMLLR